MEGIFGRNDKEYLEIIEKQEDNVEKLIDVVAALVKNQVPPNPHPDLADDFKLTIFYNGLQITANKMSIQILDTQSVTFKAVPTSKGNPSAIFPGSGIASPSDSTLFSVALDAVQDPTGASVTGTITGVLAAVGVGALNISGNADVSGKTVVTVTGSDQVGVNAPPVAQADGWSFTYGTPTP